METKFIREFLMLVDIRNFQRTAEELFISQPALSRHIKLIESELGIPIIDRSKHGVELTEFGKAFYEHAMKLNKLDKAFYSDISRYLKGDGSKKLVIRIFSSPEYWNIAKFCVDFMHENPDLEVEMKYHMYNHERLTQALESKEINFWFTYLPPYPREATTLNVQPYCTDNLCAVISKQHPLADHESISVEDIVNEPLVTLPKDSITYDTIVEIFSRSGYKFVPQYTVPLMGAISEYVSQMGVVGITLGGTVNTKEIQNILVKPIEQSPVINIGVLYATACTYAERKFIEYIQRRTKNEIWK